MIGVNQRPIGSSFAVVDRGVKTAITLKVVDPDYSDKETFKITSIGAYPKYIPI